MAFIVPDVKIDFKEVICGFIIPSIIRDDIVYCQKNLRLYIKIYQDIVSRLNENIQHKVVQRSLREIESEIMEMDSEQKVLVSQLRRCLEDFYISIKSDNVEIDREYGTQYITEQLHRLMNTEHNCSPTTVKRRLTKKQLTDRVDEISKFLKTFNANASKNSKQVSLLKPKAERIVTPKKIENEIIIPQKTTKLNTKQVSQTVNQGRLNLLQALKRAKNERLNNKPKSNSKTPSPPLSQNTSDRSESPDSLKFEDLADVPSTSPTNSDENKEELIQNNQEVFLRIFDLYTHAHCQYLRQRRSKRCKRNIRNNENSDFHYDKTEITERQTLLKPGDMYIPKKNYYKKTTYLAPSNVNQQILKRKRDEQKCQSILTFNVSSASEGSSSPEMFSCKEEDDILAKCDNCLNSVSYKYQSKMSETNLCIQCRTEFEQESNTDMATDREELKCLESTNNELKQTQELLWKELMELEKTMQNLKKQNFNFTKKLKKIATETMSYQNIISFFEKID